MKNLLLAIAICLATVTANAQTERSMNVVSIKNYNGRASFFTIGDTLTINGSPQFKYIQFGGRTYEVVPATLKEVQPSLYLPLIQPYYNGSLPYYKENPNFPDIRFDSVSTLRISPIWRGDTLTRRIIGKPMLLTQ